MSDDQKKTKVFISYAREDIVTARKLYKDIEKAGATPWLDEYDLLPGQNWKMTINQVLKSTSYILVLLSSRSLSKRGYVQKEMKMALDLLDEFPVDEIFVIPVRLDECQSLDERLQDLHHVDLFPDYEAGLAKILQVLSPGKRVLPPGKAIKPGLEMIHILHISDIHIIKNRMKPKNIAWPLRRIWSKS